MSNKPYHEGFIPPFNIILRRTQRLSTRTCCPDAGCIIPIRRLLFGVSIDISRQFLSPVLMIYVDGIRTIEMQKPSQRYNSKFSCWT